MKQARDYSFLDRAIHRLAFSSPAIQLSAADIERPLYGRRYRDITVERPVFITSLPRAGTTLLLEVFSRVDVFATHRYRDMPFILAPVLWQAISGGFRKKATLKERAHGDGMQVGYDSPEAFEEVLWCAHWPDHYRDDHILPWTGSRAAPDFRDAFIEHMQKIIALRAMDRPGARRYVSKNNASIGRIELLKALFPDAVILVPFRNPVDHAASMLRQHLNFLERHAQDPFAETYMGDIGHFEFGALHRPIRFNRTGDVSPPGNPAQLDYWLAYWVDAFEHIYAHRDHVLLFSLEQAGNDGRRAVRMLGERVDPAFYGDLEVLAGMFRNPPSYDQSASINDTPLRERAEALHLQLLRASIT